MQVTVGEEGFWAESSPWGAFNPWGDHPPKNWSYGTGQDFSAQHALPAIDFAGMHLWPDNWAVNYGAPAIFRQRYLIICFKPHHGACSDADGWSSQPAALT